MKTRIEVIIVLSSLALIAITGTWAILFLIYVKVDPGLLAIASGIVGNATGALAAVLSTTGRTIPSGDAQNPVQTEIVNTPENPVITEPQTPPAVFESGEDTGTDGDTSDHSVSVMPEPTPIPLRPAAKSPGETKAPPSFPGTTIKRRGHDTFLSG